MTRERPDSENRLRSGIQTTPIAVIGMACLFPEARNLREFWDNIIRKRDCIKDVPPDRWDVNDYYDPDPKAPDKTYCKRGAFLPEIDFDPMEFGIPPNILELTEVSQLLSLVVAKEVLEDAGYGESSDFDRDRIGVVLGVAGGQKLITPLTARLQYPLWRKVLRKSGISEEDTQIIVEKIGKAYIPWEENSFPGMLGNVIAGRIANRLNLGGTNCVVDTACASSLTALKMAVSELLEHRSDIVITGGVDTDNSIFMYMCFSKTPAFTDRHLCSPFDIDSNGMMVGEGIGMLALKRLEDAERDQDRIYAVIRGIGSSSDGRFSSIYNPRPGGQEKALKRAYEDAGVPPSTIGLVEAHGTGTKAGDPAEVQALKAVFGEDNPKTQRIALGSVKSQIGHTKAAAGVAGLIKTAMALYHKVLPPTINVNKPNPKFDLENSPFYVNTETRPWIHTDEGLPRRAAVSAFGFGGTNFHVVLEEHRAQATGSYRLHRVPKSLLLFAQTPEELKDRCATVLEELKSEAAERKVQELAASCRSLVIPQEAARIGFVSDSCTESHELLTLALETLEGRGGEVDWSLPKGVYYRRRGMDLKGKIVALFSGQGSQVLGMGKELACNFPVILQAYREMDRLFVRDGWIPLSEVVFPKPAFDGGQRKADEELLRKTEFAQPAIGVFSAGLYRILVEAGFKPDFVGGHSFGELTALWAAGVLSDADYFSLARERGRAMAAPDVPGFDAGGMLAVIGDAEQIRKEVEEHPAVVVANVNSRQEVVLAGPTTALAALQEPLKSKGYRVIALPVSAAFHTPFIEHAQKPFVEALGAAEFRRPRCPVYSNTTGRPYPPDPEALRKLLGEHLLNPVHFREEIENIYKDGGTLFVEFGPKGILTKLVGNILEEKPHEAISLQASPNRGSDRQLRQAVVQLRVAGLPLRDIDPHPVEAPILKGKSRGPATVRLAGVNYVSERTRQAFLDALNDTPQARLQASGNPDEATEKTQAEEGLRQAVSSGAVSPGSQVEGLSLPSSKRAEKSPSPSPQGRPVGVAPGAVSPIDGKGLLESVEQGLALFFKHQGETLQVHEQYLNQHLEYTRTFHDLMRQQSSLPGSGSNPNMPEGLERSMAMFHDHQAETLRVHEQYLRGQAETSRTAIEVLKQNVSLMTSRGSAPIRKEGVSLAPSRSEPFFREDSLSQGPAACRTAEFVSPLDTSALPGKLHGTIHPAVTTEAVPGATVQQSLPSAVPSVSVPGMEALTEAMLRVVSEKTGYPVEMLEPDMEMEADLGIDSIKRVEILGTMMDLYPDLPEMNPEELSQLRTLGEIVQYLGAALSSGGGAAPVVTASVAGKATAAACAPGVSVPGMEALTEAMLRVVSEKTGYPVEMLEPDMEMEADLGIDSIKRVEILGTMMDLYPDLPEMNPEELSQLRTLGQIVEYMGSCLSSAGGAGLSGGEESRQMDEALPQSPTAEETVPKALVRLQRLPAPDALDFTLPEGHVCLLTDDGTSMTAALAEALMQRGWRVVVLRFPPSTIPEGPASTAAFPRIALRDLSEKHLQERLEEISAEHGPVGGLVHLHPRCRQDAGDGIVFSETSRDLLLHVFLLAKHLKPSLTRTAPPGRRFFVAVARLNGTLGVGEGAFGVVDGGLFGLVKTLNLEWDSVFCRAVDLAPNLDEAGSISSILQELHDPDIRIVETGWGTQGRVTLVAEPWEPMRRVTPEGLPEASSVFLVSGGARGVTASCVARLASACGCRFVLLGRSPFTGEEPGWARGCYDVAELKRRGMEEIRATGEKPTPKRVEEMLKPVFAGREISSTLSAIREAGGEAEYVQADVTDSEALGRVGPVVERMGELTGVIHGAGVLADRRIETKTIRDFDAVYSTKVKGLEALLRFVDSSRLRYLVLFSSAAGFFGNPGQSDYAMANEILNKMAHQFQKRHRDCHVRAFNWGPWDGGMVSPSLKKLFEERNIPLIPVEGGVEVFVEGFSPNADENPQILVGSPLVVEGGDPSPEPKSYRIVRRLHADDNPFLQDHVIGGKAVLPVVCAIAWMADACEQFYPGHRFFRYDDYRTWKGIVFDETLADEYIVDIEELWKADSGEIRFEVMISSRQPGGDRLVHHYRSGITLLREVPEAPFYEDFDRKEEEAIDGSFLYRDGTLFHGPLFRVVERILNMRRDKLTLRCCVPGLEATEQGPFPVRTFHPYAADAQFQSMLIWVRKYCDAGSLPSKARAGEQYRPLPGCGELYVSLDVKSATRTRMVADITTHDDTGRIYTRVFDAEVTISKQLNELFGKAASR